MTSPASAPPSLVGAVTSLRTSTSLLSSSLSILTAATADFPRLSRILWQKRHFELLPSSALASAQAALLSELAPEVESLLSRVEAHVERLERREGSLRARWELQEGRLGRARQEYEGGGSGIGYQDEGRATAKKVDSAREELKAKQTRQKKDRLSYAVDRLTLQVQQTERKLRQSMAAQEQRPARDEEDELA